MRYEPQPGTIQHSAVAWLRSMNRVNPGQWVSSIELCEALDTITQEFSAYMAPCRAHGIVKAEKRGPHLYWQIGDGQEVGYANIRPSDESDPTKPKKSKPLKAWKAPKFRALAWDGRVLVTGMEIRDGVAIFTQDQLRQIQCQASSLG